ncbi:conserved hypothetical protein [uncultured Eubacteriales bacterium]|uniref:Spore protein YkvP/CgeB glycosyl transferase-like domain-containing protein n=1 Tax=uncultured Eubacteriales bacterium TaxID=172733 RepID=A0A212JPY2_9FIRM|nr:conserved hypothetical protein [uncultured Eubacteriales bacterium]
MKQYICLAPSPWSAAPTRTQHLMSRLRDAKILYFEPSCPIGSRAHKKPARQVRPGVTVYTLPPVLHVEPQHSLLLERQHRRLARFIQQKLDVHRFRDPILWATSPEQVHLLDKLPLRGMVYDCDQDWPQLPLEWESDLALAAEVIFAASPGLIKHLAPCNDNIALLPNGVNFPMFSREGLETPPELQGLKAPVLGWVGRIHRDTDLSPLLQAAQDLTGCAFVLVGRVEKNPLASTLRALPNVIFTGERPLAELPEYLAHFDVCMNLLRRGDVGSDVIPERVYQYLSAGKPIVSMLWEDQVEDFPDVVYAAHSPAEFSQLCRRALAEPGDWARNRRREYGAGAAWSVRADEVYRILETIGLY